MPELKIKCQRHGHTLVMWDVFCMSNNVNIYLYTWEDPVPELQSFGERYLDG
jgi:hypothetical protein